MTNYLNNLVSYAADFFLSFSHATVVVPLIIVGLLWIDRRIFYHALYLILMSIILNGALKYTFQIPLSSHLGKTGFAFPSGHMQFATVLYGWLALQFKNIIFRVLSILLLIAIALSLHYFGYHTYFDIGGALIVAGFLIGLYYLIWRYYENWIPLILLMTASSLMLYILLYYGVIPFYITRAYCILLAVITGVKLWHYFYKQ